MVHSRGRVRSGIGAAVLAAVVVGGCSAGSGDSSTGGGTGETAADVAAPDSSRAQSGAAGPGAARQAVVRTRAVVRTGELSLTAEDLGEVRREIDDLLQAVGGSVDEEDSTNDRRGRVDSSTLTLRVPVAAFDSTKRALERVGTLESSTASGKDVTTQVIDTRERVETLQNSLDRLQRFQRSATDVGDLIRYEDQITSRQSELQSLQAQQAYLADQTSMSTLTVHLSTPDTREAKGRLDDAGFLSGLRGGRDALVGVAVVALTVLGAALPFMAALAVLGVPAWLLWRLARARRSAPPSAPPSAEPTGGA